MADVSLVTIDVGNSRVKLAWFLTPPVDAAHSEPTGVVNWRHDGPDAWPDVKPQNAIIGSVAPELSAALLEAVPADWPTITPVCSSDFKIACDGPQLANVGVDRIANAKAASILYPNEDVIIVDAGTATTVDLVSSNGAFRGGAISPGLQMSADALTRRTELLPSIKMADNQPATYPAATTENAIRLGAAAATIGGIERAITAARSASSQSARVVYCGGNGRYVAQTLGHDAVVPALTILGLAWFDKP